ncbi:uncharacterized protein LOC104871650 isoform X2 [Fukomys damarensis]|uniref:uncharacterized protein LOC104871650 isoform X2 n=1 Tax=Fukomys damarensis TaxID=885580 RepID=UPI0008FF1F87|nr:uncharacterized protein LOC104871650 isoform X2 [Fukomys damarensis]
MLTLLLICLLPDQDIEEEEAAQFFNQGDQAIGTFRDESNLQPLLTFPRSPSLPCLRPGCLPHPPQLHILLRCPTPPSSVCVPGISVSSPSPLRLQLAVSPVMPNLKRKLSNVPAAGLSSCLAMTLSSAQEPSEPQGVTMLRSLALMPPWPQLVVGTRQPLIFWK